MGLLEPLLEYLEIQIRVASRPLEPEGSDWPYSRAFRDGEASQAVKTLSWIEGRSHTTPDGAQNTGE